MLNNNTQVIYATTVTSEKQHIRKHNDARLEVYCGVNADYTTPAFVNPMRADICKTCSKIHNKLTLES